MLSLADPSSSARDGLAAMSLLLMLLFVGGAAAGVHSGSGAPSMPLNMSPAH